jgi:competence protein ComEC
MRRPCLYALLLFVSGIVLGNFLDLPLILLGSILALIIAFCAIFLLLKDVLSARLFMVLALIMGGFLRHELLTKDYPAHHITKFLDSNSPVTITGKIAEDPDVRKTKTFLTVDTQKISLGERTLGTTGKIILKIKEATFRFDYADDIRFSGYLNPPVSGRNPGAFDYQRYLNRKGIFGVVNLPVSKKVEIIGETSGNMFLSQIIIPLRGWILEVFNSNLSGNHEALLSGFLLGETREIPERIYTMFRDTGTVHLLVVSGSNVWLVVGVLLAALALLRVPKLPSTILGLFCIFVFANLVHNDPPVVRAGIMAGVVLVGLLLYRDIDLINSVSFSGLAILLFSPLFLFDVGFQLSFASVFAILLLYPELKKLVLRYVQKSHRFLWRWVITPALISLSVELVIFPILGYYFNMVPLITVVANIFIVPLAGLSVVLACFTLISATFSITLAGVFSACNWLCLELTLYLTQVFANFPLAKLIIPAPPASTFILYYFFLWLLVSNIVSKKKALLFSVLIIANILVWKEGLASSQGSLKMTCLDVGRGSSTIIEYPGGQTFLINAGEKQGGFDDGEHVVVPFLYYEGKTKIDKLILTDTDSLSMNSAKSVLLNVEVQNILSANHLSFSDENLAAATKRTVNKYSSLDSIKDMDGGRNPLEITLIEYPEPVKIGEGNGNLLTRVVYRNTIFILLDGMKQVHFESEFDWDLFKNCIVLVMPETGEVDEMVEIISAIRPKTIIFTRHYFRYQKEKVPTLMQVNFPEIEYLRTAESGAIVCKTDGEEVWFDVTIK